MDYYVEINEMNANFSSWFSSYNCYQLSSLPGNFFHALNIFCMHRTIWLLLNGHFYLTGGEIWYDEYYIDIKHY